MLTPSPIKSNSPGNVAEQNPTSRTVFTADGYDLAATLACGQAFRWERNGGSWVGIVNRRWVRLSQTGNRIEAETVEQQRHWDWLADYLQIEADMESVLATFPDDAAMRSAMKACRGLRLLRQEPWECLASFILSSTKQIVQIRQIIATLAARHGETVAAPLDGSPTFAFPRAESIAALSEAELRACKMGFRAPYLLETARRVTDGECDLEALRQMPVGLAREELMKLPGVGEKVANCVLLFGYGFPTAFPVDVWVIKALRQFYFKGRKVRPARLRDFSANHFGPNAGYAQQYLFHWVRMQSKKELST